MKVAVLWTGLSGYLNACLRELAGRNGIELFVCHSAPDANAPFDEGQFGWITDRFTWWPDSDLESLRQKLRRFTPDILIFSGWHVPAYRRMAQESANRSWRVMTMDNPWRGTLRQRAATLVSGIYLRPLADAVWLPGERQAIFARKLGFSQSEILRGLYACDYSSFEAIHIARIESRTPLPRRFVFVGRLMADKGIDELMMAYRLYRSRTQTPWPLVCCGTGPMRTQLATEDGIEMEGFVQPDRLPEVLGSAGCLILPSRFERWGLVVHEAATAGRLILASETVGAAPHLAQPGYNGFIFENSDIAGLADLMLRVAAMPDSYLDEMSRASHLLSKQFSPKQWANTLLQSFYARSANSQPHAPSAVMH